MSITVRIPTVLRKFTGDAECVETEGHDVAEAIENLEAGCPGIKNRIFDDGGALRRFVNVYLNGEDIRFMSGLKTETPDGCELSIIPSVAGG
ncbi:MAG: ubiquitin-like small modifier protein 1 [bacterium]